MSMTLKVANQEVVHALRELGVNYLKQVSALKNFYSHKTRISSINMDMWKITGIKKRYLLTVNIDKRIVYPPPKKAVFATVFIDIMTDNNGMTTDRVCSQSFRYYNEDRFIKEVSSWVNSLKLPTLFIMFKKH